MKKFVSSALALAMLAGSGAALAAEDQDTQPLVATPYEGTEEQRVEDTELDSAFSQLPSNVMQLGDEYITVHALNRLSLSLQHGTIGSYDSENHRVSVLGVDENGESYVQIILNISDTTRVLDAVTGDSVALADLREGETVYAYTSPAMTLSLPPQSAAELLLVNIPQDYMVPFYTEIERVTVNDNGSVTLSTDADINVTVTDDTTLTPYLTRQMLYKETLQPGQKILVWSGAIAETFPAQAEASKLLVFNTAYRGTLGLNSDGIVTLNSEALLFNRMIMPYIEDGTYMLPFRQVVEALGYTVDWQAEGNMVVVSDAGGIELYRFSLNGSTVTMADGSEVYAEYTVSPDNFSTYMSLDDLLILQSLKFVNLTD